MRAATATLDILCACVMVMSLIRKHNLRWPENGRDQRVSLVCVNWDVRWFAEFVHEASEPRHVFIVCVQIREWERLLLPPMGNAILLMQFL